MSRSERFISVVTRGHSPFKDGRERPYGPRVHHFRKKMDCRIKSGNDVELNQSNRDPH